MAHKYTFKVSPNALVRDESGVADEDQNLTPEAIAIHDQFVSEGKVTGQAQSEEKEEDGSYVQSITFLDSATCDEYLAAMAGIGEVEKSGGSRSEHSREDV
tara:strand:+ start:1315 stop:1617 length:303 start_codon:yes stop_codon:yes gene_type:complete